MQFKKPFKEKRLTFKNSKGEIMKYINSKDFFFKRFGEIYFNKTLKNKKKGWIFHKKNTCLISPIVGRIFFHIINGDKLSLSFGKEYKFDIDSKQFEILVIPKKFWFSFYTKNNYAIFANLIEKPHSDKEVLKNTIIKNYRIA